MGRWILFGVGGAFILVGLILALRKQPEPAQPKALAETLIAKLLEAIAKASPPVACFLIGAALVLAGAFYDQLGRLISAPSQSTSTSDGAIVQRADGGG